MQFLIKFSKIHHVCEGTRSKGAEEGKREEEERRIDRARVGLDALNPQFSGIKPPPLT